MKDSQISHKVLMLRPMRAGASGFARLHRQGRYASLQIRVRGISQEGFQAYWHDGGGADVLLGSAICDARGEATLNADLPEDCSLMPGRLQALLLVENKQQPGPLMIGLWADASAGSMMDARNACLALCDHLRVRPTRPEPAPPEPPADDPSPAMPELSQAEESATETSPLPMEDIRQALATVDFPKQRPLRREPVVLLLTEEKPVPPPSQDPPREIFLTAIDPLPYVEAAERERPPAAAPVPAPSVEQPSRKPADALPELRWPRLFRPLREYFLRCPPTGLFPLPGWRFVCASRQGDGLWIGRKVEDGTVTRVAYVMRGAASGEYQPLMGADGREYRALVQRGE